MPQSQNRTNRRTNSQQDVEETVHTSSSHPTPQDTEERLYDSQSDEHGLLPGYVMDKAELIKRLFRTGWLIIQDKTPTEDELESSDIISVTERQLAAALMGWQQFQGLKPDAWAGPMTERTMHSPRMCQLPDVMPLEERLCKWPMVSVTWSVTGSVGTFSQQDYLAAVNEAFKYWTDICGLKTTYSANSRTANIVMASGRIDRPGGTLAWSELPCGASPTTQLKQMYDTSESWVIAEDPAPNQIDFVRVAAHEIGHAIGLPHIANGNLLAPMYNPRVRRPQAGDIQEAVSRYGPSTSTPLPPVPPPGGTRREVSLVIDGTGSIVEVDIPGWRCTKVVA